MAEYEIYKQYLDSSASSSGAIKATTDVIDTPDLGKSKEIYSLKDKITCDLYRENKFDISKIKLGFIGRDNEDNTHIIKFDFGDISNKHYYLKDDTDYNLELKLFYLNKSEETSLDRFHGIHGTALVHSEDDIQGRFYPTNGQLLILENNRDEYLSYEIELSHDFYITRDSTYKANVNITLA